MGSQILIAMDTQQGVLSETNQEVVHWFEEWEQLFSRFRITSELSELNAHTGQDWPVSEEFFTVLQQVLLEERLSKGLVTPAVLDALEEAGYDQSFENMMETMTSSLRKSYVNNGNAQDIRMDESQLTVHLPVGMRLDLGGFVKGWAADQTMQRLQGTAPVLVDAGGDIAISGPMKNGDRWPVGIADPMTANGSLGVLMLGRSGIATSGKDYRRWMKGNRWQHHIIDPRTGRPAESDLISVTIMAKNVIEAELWTKAALIVGSTRAIRLLAENGIESYLLVMEDGQQIESVPFAQARWSERWISQKSKISA
jgi:thiamine biosynthesis lipoprotein